MERVSTQIDGFEFVVRYGAPGRVSVGVQLALNPQPRPGRGRPDQVHHHLVADQRLSAPVLTDRGEQAVFDLVPLAGPWWEVAHVDFKARLIRQFLQLQLPQAEPIPIAAARVGRYQQPSGARVERLPHAAPPTPDALDGKSSRIVVRPHTDPGLVLGDIVHPIRTDPAQIRNQEVMHQHLLRRSLGTQLPPTVLEGPHQFLLLRVHGDHRLSQGELQLHRPVQVLKLGVAVRVFRPRQGLAIGLQAIAHVVEQFGDHAMADLVPLALQCRRQLTHALAGPAQRGLGIPTAGRLHQPVQVLAQARVMLDGALPAASRMADAALRGPYGRLAQLPYAAANRPARSSGGPCNRCLATTPGRRRLSGKHQPPHPLVHNGGNRLVTSLNRSFNYHPLSIAEHVVKNKLFRDSSLGHPRQPVGWNDLLDKASRDARFRWSHSSVSTGSGLLSTTAEFYAGTGERRSLTQDDLTSKQTRNFVRNIEATVTRYGGESEDRVVTRLLAEGGRPLDAFVAQEQSVIYFNRNANYQNLVAIYPEEGTFWMDHPLVSLDGPWVSERQRLTIREFAAYITSPDAQISVLRAGYRPVDPSLSLESPISLIKPEYGADPAEPKRLLKVPSASLLENIREAWLTLKRPADIYLVVDVSGSMGKEKLTGTKEALLSFIEQIRGDRDRVALVPFSDGIGDVVPLGPSDSAALRENIAALEAGGGTELYQAVAYAYELIRSNTSDDRIGVILAMTDGKSDGEIATLESWAKRDEGSVMIFTVGYGKDADFDVLRRLSSLGAGQTYRSDPNTIRKLYMLIAANF